MKRRTFKIFLEKDVPKSANSVGGRFVLAMKDAGTKNEIHKASFVVQGHTDAEKNLKVHPSPNPRPQTVKILIAVAALFRFGLWSQDVSQAYLQSASKLTREVYIKQRLGIRIRLDQLPKLLKHLYGLSESGDYRHATMATHLKKDLGMTPLTVYYVCFIKSVHENLSGMIGTYVDDCYKRYKFEKRKQTDKV